MRRLMFLFLILGLSAVPALAQKAELFGGYQLTHFDGGTNFNGWNASVTGNFAPFLGVTADFSGVYKSGAKFHTYTFGPEFHAHLPVVKPFAHALFGGGTASASGISNSGFTMYYGAGLDVKAGPAVAVRVGQFDWMVTRFNGVTDKKNFRYSAGLVLRF